MTGGIVHLGLGAFHRAHQAVYTQDAGGWGIAGVSLRSETATRPLTAQGCVYGVEERAPGETRRQTITCVEQALFAPGESAAVLALLAAAATRVVTLTITEQGYCLEPASRRLDVAHPDIAHDLAGPAVPRSAIGWLARGLERRRRAGAPPLSILSCDNLPRNGAALRAAVLAFLERADPETARYAAANAVFPCTVVDRIVPATRPEDVERAAAATGARDEALVVTEPFKQWIIEDSCLAARPAWERAGARFVADTAPYEDMKLRLLNAAHSALAYLGQLRGLATVHETIASPGARELVLALFAEVTPTLAPLPGFDVGAYQASLLRRFANEALPHMTAQIAKDGVAKIPARILPSIRLLRAAGAPHAALSRAVALWLEFLGDDAMPRRADVFGADLAGDAAFQKGILPKSNARSTNQSAATIAAASEPP